MNGMTRRPLLFPARAAGVLLLLSLFLVPCAPSAAATRVAVMDFAVNGVEAHLGRSVAELIITDLTGTAGCEVVERGQLERLAREHKLQASGLVDAQTAVRMGKLTGAAYVIVGSVNAMQQTYILAARLVDVQRGTSLSGFKSVSTTGEAGLYDATVRLTGDIVANFGGAAAPTRTPPGRPTPVPTRGPLPTPRPVVTPKADANTIELDLTKDPGRPLFKGQYASESITDRGTALVAKKEGQGVTVNRALPSTFMTASALEAEILVQHCDGALVGLVLTGKDGSMCFDALSDGRTRIRANRLTGDKGQTIVNGELWSVSWPAVIRVRYDVASKTFTGFANGRRVLSLPLAGRKDIPAFFPSWQVGFYAIGRSDVGAGDYAVFSKLRITAAP